MKQARLCKDVDRIFTGAAPPLVRVSHAYGRLQTELFVGTFIDDLCRYTGVKAKMTHAQMHETAAVIVSEYGYLTMAEIMYFFFLFKAGRFGKFYGAVDPLVITNALKDFLDVRNAELDRIERKRRTEEARAESERRKGQCVTFDEYTTLKWLLAWIAGQELLIDQLLSTKPKCQGQTQKRQTQPRSA